MGIQNEEEVRLIVRLKMKTRVLRVSQRQHDTLSEGAEFEPALTQNTLRSLSLRLLNAFLSSSLSVSPASIDTFLSSQQTQTTLTVQTGLNYGQYFASDSTCDAITSLLSRYLSSQNPSQPLTLIEPSCGTGELLTKGTQGNIISALLSCPLKNVSVKCVDLDATVLPICEESVGKLLRGVDDDKRMTVEVRSV